MDARTKTFGLRLLLFSLLVVCVHALVTPFVVDDVVGGVKLVALGNSVRAIRHQRTDVLVFGDSVATYREPDTPADSSIAELLPRLLPGCRTTVVSGGALHLQLYEAFGMYISRNPPETRPQVVVIPISLRSFATIWTARPAWKLELLRRRFIRDSFAYDLTMSPLSVFKWYDGIEGNMEDFLAAPVYFGTRKVGTIGGIGLFDANFRYRPVNPSDAKRLLAITFYMEAVRPDSERFQAMIRLARRLKQADITPLFYVTPVDWEMCRRWLGDPAVVQIEANVRTVADGLAAEGVHVRDWATALGSPAFSYGDLPSEHLALAGRTWLASAIAVAVKEEAAPGGRCGDRGR